MRILLVAATSLEFGPLLQRLPPGEHRTRGLTVSGYAGHQVDLLVTGVGMVATAVRVSAVLARERYGLALNLGVCGSFDPALRPGAVVHVVSDTLSELGAEDGDDFLSAGALQLIADDEFPFRDGALHNDPPPSNAGLTRLPPVRGITVNTVHGADASIARIRQRLDPQVETMEGAAFMYSCLVHGTPFAQVRAVSNMVERRNRGAWRLDEAILRLAEAATGVMDHACD